MLSARSLTLKPRDLGRTVEVSGEPNEPPLAQFGGGRLVDAGGQPLLQIAVDAPGGARRDRPGDVSLQVADAAGTPAGVVKIVKYGFGPRAKKLTLVLMRPDGAEDGRIEPGDDRGEQLVATVGGAAAATISIEQVKVGFLRKARVYDVQLSAEPSPLLLGAIVGYEALLQAAMAAAMRD